MCSSNLSISYRKLYILYYIPNEKTSYSFHFVRLLFSCLLFACLVSSWYCIIYMIQMTWCGIVWYRSFILWTQNKTCDAQRNLLQYEQKSENLISLNLCLFIRFNFVYIYENYEILRTPSCSQKPRRWYNHAILLHDSSCEGINKVRSIHIFTHTSTYPKHIPKSILTSNKTKTCHHFHKFLLVKNRYHHPFKNSYSITHKLLQSTAQYQHFHSSSSKFQSSLKLSVCLFALPFFCIAYTIPEHQCASRDSYQMHYIHTCLDYVTVYSKLNP